jgi:hypothetical protein
LANSKWFNPNFQSKIKDKQDKIAEKNACEFFYFNEHELSLDNNDKKENLACLEENEKLYQNLTSFDLKIFKLSEKYNWFCFF